MTPTGPDTFEYPFASSVLGNIPPDSNVYISVIDDAVSTTSNLARDIYVNDTKVSVTDLGQELGTFKERSDGTIY